MKRIRANREGYSPKIPIQTNTDQDRIPGSALNKELWMFVYMYVYYRFTALKSIRSNRSSTAAVNYRDHYIRPLPPSYKFFFSC